MAVKARKFQPKEGVEKATVTLNPRNAGKPITINSWPYSTKDDDIARSLAASRNLEEVEGDGPKATTGAIRAAQNSNVNLDEVSPSDGEQITADDVKNHAESGGGNAGSPPDASHGGGQGVNQPPPPRETK